MKHISCNDTESPTKEASVSIETKETAWRRSWRLPLTIGGAGLLALAGSLVMVRRAESKANQAAPDLPPKSVSLVEARQATFRVSRTYVGTIDPWVEAKVGPQFVSAYVDTVLVRPGTVVKKGTILATLDCRNSNAKSQAVAMQAQALDAEHKAIADEASRVHGLLEGGFVSPNEAEQKSAQSSAGQAQLFATRARLLGTSLEVNDCVLRSPFDGEIATRTIDPGAFVRPGTPLISVVDRSTVRISADAPELDFDVVSPGTQVDVRSLATGRKLAAGISRRAPAADRSTRTVHFEIDIPDAKRELPVGTTADLRIDLGDSQAATAIPLHAATVKGKQATFFVAEGGFAHKRVVPIKGERDGELYLDTALAPRTRVVSQGRALLNENDPVVDQVQVAIPPLPRPLEPERSTL